MKNYRLFFVFILILTVFTLFLNLSEPFSINFTVPVPFSNRTVPVHTKFPGLNNLLPAPLRINRNLGFRKGLDLEGGTSITLKADMATIPESQRDNALNSAKAVIEKRVNFFGVSEPVVQTSRVGRDYRIIVEIPGVTDVNEAVKLVGRTAKLTFWEEGTDNSASSSATSSAIPRGITQVLGPKAKKTDLTGGDLQQAAVTFNPNSGKPQVELKFTGEGAKKFGEITKRNVGKIVAIALDDQIVEAPRVNEPIYGGNAVITGEFTTQQAKTLQIQLNAGALPVSLSVLEQKAIGASLGRESLQKSLFAGLLGFLVIVLFMVILYGRLGFIASLALVVYTLIVLSLFRLIPVTLTLAGIAGFILSIGIAVDANILIFERMKEELRRGRSQEMVLDLGFSRAWPSIRDSNVSSLITSSVLYYFGTTIVRGFAFTLALGVIVSMFSAIVVTRTFLQVFYRKK